MKLFAAIAATTMISQAADEDSTDLIVYNGEEEFCLNEKQQEKVGFVKNMVQDLEVSSKNKKYSDACESGSGVVLDWGTYGKKVAWTEAKKAFKFLTSDQTVVPAPHWSIPKPMTSSFNDMKLHENKVEIEVQKVEEGGEWVNRHVEKVTKKEDIPTPDGIKSFFAFQVDKSPENEEARIKAITDSNKNQNEVAGQYGSINLKDQGVNDGYLNQEQYGNVFDRDYKVNNPRELINLIEAANALDYQDLLNFASAKLASGIRDNQLWRLRAILGFSPTGDYTNHTYKVVKKEGEEEETVAGYVDLLEDNAWFNPKEDKNAVYKAAGTVEEEYLPEKLQYTDITNKDRMKKIMDRDYPAAKGGWISVKNKNGDEICANNSFTNF